MARIEDYSELEGDAKAQQALEDLIGFIGVKQFVKVSLSLRREQVSLETFLQIGTLTGVEGYPLKAWHQLLFGEDQ